MKALSVILLCSVLVGCIVVPISPKGSGTIIDKDTGNAVPGVSVTVTHPRLDWKAKSKLSDEDGVFRLPVLRMVTSIPFSAIRIEGIVRFEKDGYETTEIKVQLDESMNYKSSNIGVVEIKRR